MDAIQAKKIFDEADVKEVDGGFCIISAEGLFSQTQRIVMDAYNNAAYLDIFLGEVMKKDVFKLKLLNINDRKRIEAFVKINKAWCRHAREFLGASFHDLGHESSEEGILTKYFDEMSEIHSSRQSGNVVRFPAARDERQEVSEFKRFLKVSGFKILPNDVLSREDAESVILNIKEFIRDAYDNAKIARIIVSDLLSADGEIHVLIGEQLLDDLSYAAAKNEAWMIITNRSFYSGEDHLCRDTSVSKKDIESAASSHSNVSLMPFSGSKPKGRPKIEMNPLGIYRL